MATGALAGTSHHPVHNRVPLDGGDERLVARIRAGDDSAFDTIYDRYHRGLLAFCRHLLGSRQEAEDALQHSFASAYLALRRGTGDVALRPWLYTIARNRCLSEMRARRQHLDVAAIADGGSALEGLAAEVQRRSDLRDLVDDVQRLPEDQRAALVLFELGDHSHEEIAEVLGVRREKVKALVFQAREGLMRARRARETPCAQIREELANRRGKSPRDGVLGIHIDRCAACAAYDLDVRRQRRALAAILPVVPSVGLKASVLGSAVGGGAAAVGGAGAGGGGVAAVGSAGAGGGGVAAAGGVAGGGGAAAAGGAVAGGAAAGGAGGVAGGLGGAGAAAASGAVAGGAAVSGVAGGIVGLGAKSVVVQLVAIVAVAGGGAATRHVSHEPHKFHAPPPMRQQAALPPQSAGTAPLGSAPLGAPAPAPSVGDAADPTPPAADRPADPTPATAAVTPPAAPLSAADLTTAALPGPTTADPTPALVTPAATPAQTTTDAASTTPAATTTDSAPTPVDPTTTTDTQTAPASPPVDHTTSSTPPTTTGDTTSEPPTDSQPPTTTEPQPVNQDPAEPTQTSPSGSDVAAGGG